MAAMQTADVIDMSDRHILTPVGMSNNKNNVKSRPTMEKTENIG
jgi:hypothetical protein